MRTECHSEGQFFAVRGHGCRHHTRLQQDKALVFILSAQLTNASSGLMCYRCEGKNVRINVNVLGQLTVHALRVSLAICFFLYHYFKRSVFYFIYLLLLIFRKSVALFRLFFTLKENK